MSDRGRGRGRADHGLPFNPRGRGGGRGDFGSRGGGRGDFGDGRGRGRGAPVEVQVHTQDGTTPPTPDRHVEQIENNSMISLKGKKPPDEMPPRPGYGIKGKPVVLWTNYFKLVTKDGLELYRYNITIAPDSNGRVPVGKKVKRIVQLLLEENFYPQGLDIATDFKSTLYSRQELKLEKDYTIDYRSELEDDAPANPKQYRVRLEATGSLTVAELINHLTSTQAGLMFGSKEEIIQALNIVLGHHPKASAGIATVASNRHFDMNASQQEKSSLGAGLTVIRGFFMSVPGL